MEDNWKHRWLNASDPYRAFEVWLEARWPHPFEGAWMPLALRAYAEDEAVPRGMIQPRAPMPDDPF